MGKDKIDFGKPISGFTGRPQPTPVPVIPVSGPSGFSALIYQCKLNVDWDGSPKAYGLDRPDTTTKKPGPKPGAPPITVIQTFPLQKKLLPYERAINNGSLNNARADSDRHWVGVFSRTPTEAKALLRDHFPGFGKLDADAQESLFNQFLDTRESGTDIGSLKDVFGRFPVVQLPELGGVEKGYYVSICNAHTGVTEDAWDQRRYVDAALIPYAALPNLPGVSLGDFGLLIRNSTGESIGFFFGDTGAGNHLGECSGYAKLLLAPDVNGEDSTFTFIVFPNSGKGSPGADTPGQIDSVVTNQITKIASTGDTLANKLAPAIPVGGKSVENPELYNIRRALFEWGGPRPAYEKELSRFPREHGGPETRGEDFPEDQ